MNVKDGFIKNLPLPTLGLCIGIISLGNFFNHPSIKIVCGTVVIILIIRIIIKFIKYPEFLKENLQNPISIGVLGTCPMALMIFSTYIYYLNSQIAFLLWVISIIIQLALIIYFTIRFMPKINLEDVYTTYLITYVGVTVISIVIP